MGADMAGASENHSTRQAWLSTLTLFTSMSTLFCCALPALLVTLGLGAAVAGITSSIPQLVWLSTHKVGLFIFSATMLTIAGIGQWRVRHAPCPADPAQAKACGRLRKISAIIYWVSVGIYATGFFFAFIAARIFY